MDGALPCHDCDRYSRIVWSLAARPWMHSTCSEGFCEGEIIPEERGTGGFGYDPIFLLSELGKTMAELRMDEKTALAMGAGGDEGQANFGNFILQKQLI